MVDVAELAVKALGGAFLLLGAGWVGIGLWLPDLWVTLAGGLSAAAGITLLGMAPRVADTAEKS